MYMYILLITETITRMSQLKIHNNLVCVVEWSMIYCQYILMPPLSCNFCKAVNSLRRRLIILPNFHVISFVEIEYSLVPRLLADSLSPNFCNRQTVISVTVSSSEISNIDYISLSPLVCQDVINQLVSISTIVGPNVIKGSFDVARSCCCQLHATLSAKP